jgi:hypothetical protein
MRGDVWVHYGQLYVRSGLADLGVPDPELHACFAGQQNGLCGGAVPGCLLLITGLHTGTVGLVVELHDRPPALDDSWEEIVEVPFRPVGEASLVGWAEEWQRPLELIETDYRVRYCGTGMDAGRAADTRADDEPALDVAWITPALAAMDRGEPLPPPFDDGLDNCLQQAMRSRCCSRPWNGTRSRRPGCTLVGCGGIRPRPAPGVVQRGPPGLLTVAAHENASPQPGDRTE